MKVVCLFVCSWFLFLLDKKNVKYLIYGEKKKKKVMRICFRKKYKWKEISNILEWDQALFLKSAHKTDGSKHKE